MPLLLVIAACTIRPPPEGPTPAERRAQTPAPLWLPFADEGALHAVALVHAGSAFDPIGQEGVSYRAARALLYEPELQVEGLPLDVEVGREWVLLDVSAPPDRAQEALGLLAYALTWGAPSPDALAQASADAEAELRAIEADAARLAQESLALLMYEGHPYGHPVAGRRGVAELITPESVAAHRQRTWVREAAHVGGWGEVAPPLLMELDRALQPMPSTRAPRPVPTSRPRLEGLELLIVESELPLSGLAIGQPLEHRLGPLDQAELAEAAASFTLGAAQLQLSPAEHDRHTQPALTLSLPPMPASESAPALLRSLEALESWRAAPPAPVERALSPSQLTTMGLLNGAMPTPTVPAFEALPSPQDAFVVVVTDEADALIQALSEENAAAPVKAPDTPGPGPLSFSTTTRIPQDGLLR